MPESTSDYYTSGSFSRFSICRHSKPIFQGKKFVPELWEIILKLLMGVTDQLLNANPPDDQLGHAIQKETVKV